MNKQKETESDPLQFENMVNLLAIFSEASNQLAALDAELNSEMLEEIDSRRAEYSKLQSTLTETETALENIALAHPEWFATRKSIATPYGTVKFKKSSKLEVPNEEVSICLVEQRAEKDANFKLETFISTSKALNLEALEKLDDSELARLRIRRVSDDKFSVSPAKIDLSKAVKEPAVKDAA